MTEPLENTAIPLEQLAVIEISGADAATFLHGQLTHDIAQLPPGLACLAGYCTAKGRLLASLVVWRAPQSEPPAFHALIAKDIAETVVKRLSMFVLRAKAKLAVTTLPVQGIVLRRDEAKQAEQALERAGIAGASLPSDPSPYTVVHLPDAACIAAPSADAGAARWWIVGKAGAAAQPGAEALWRAADIAAGLPWIVAATQDTFIPQTLNLDLIDGVSFTKGCYPGQEVVARSHYRGTIKRRMAHGLIEPAPASEPLPGADIYDARQPESPCGRVINAASTETGCHLLLEVQLADLDSADFRLETAEGATIRIQPLPYSIAA